MMSTGNIVRIPMIEGDASEYRVHAHDGVCALCVYRGGGHDEHNVYRVHIHAESHHWVPHKVLSACGLLRSPALTSLPLARLLTALL